MIVIASGELSFWWSARGEHVGAAHAGAETLSKFGLAMEILKNLERWLENGTQFSALRLAPLAQGVFPV
jgi:hypothetical protein